MLSEEETQEIKKQLISHIEANFPLEKIANAKQQIEAMNSEQLENFLEKNRLIKKTVEQEENGCVFCSIVSDRIKSVKIGESKNAIAVLEINPISKGHTLIIPKKHVSKIPKEVLIFANKISKKIKEKLSPKTVRISNSRLFGHEIINILPVYEKEDFNSERKPTRIEELEKIKEELEKKNEIVNKKAKTEIKHFWLPKRIP
jgi:histidine triad (HIT) family protein